MRLRRGKRALQAKTEVAQSDKTEQRQYCFSDSDTDQTSCVVAFSKGTCSSAKELSYKLVTKGGPSLFSHSSSHILTVKNCLLVNSTSEMPTSGCSCDLFVWVGLSDVFSVFVGCLCPCQCTFSRVRNWLLNSLTCGFFL